MKCRECPDYTKCVKESNLAIKRKNCPKAKTEKAKTNADRIRAMSDEELAEFMKHKGRCPDETKHRGCVLSCGECWLEWLKQPAEESLWNG